MSTWSSVVAPDVVGFTTHGATDNDKVGIMSILGFQSLKYIIYLNTLSI